MYTCIYNLLVRDHSDECLASIMTFLIRIILSVISSKLIELFMGLACYNNKTNLYIQSVN